MWKKYQHDLNRLETRVLGGFIGVSQTSVISLDLLD